MKYFAYGSNLHHQQMRNRCAQSSYLRRAFLNGYRFVYDGYSYVRKGAVANIIRSDKEMIWGALYEISVQDLEALDRFEGIREKEYVREKMRVYDDTGTICDAWVYLRKDKLPGEPSPEYRATVLEGAQMCGLPDVYIEDYLKK